MSEELKRSVQEMLKEERWTRTTISNYTNKNLTELAQIVETAKSENCVDEIKEICDEHLTHSKDSIVALYLSGILGIKKGSLDYTALETLVDIFSNNHKEAIVESLCDAILKEDENNKFALRTQIECCKNEKSEKAGEIWSLYERLVKADVEEANAAKLLALHYEETDPLKALDYYKKAILRFISQKNTTEVAVVWDKLVKGNPNDLEFFKLLQKKIAQHINADKSATLMMQLYQHYKDNEKWDTAIDILKINLDIDPKDNVSRKEIAECYAKKYKDHSHIEEYIREAGLQQGYRNVFDAIEDFEKHIAFDVNNYVFHKTWKVGIITAINPGVENKQDMLVINFGKRNGVHEISLKMAVSCLTPLPKNHFLVLKARKPAALSAKIKEDKVWALKMLIKSFGNSCDIKKLKAELVPSMLTATEWTSWNTAAKKILETNDIFDKNSDNEYTVREAPITIEEKLSNEFKAQKQFFPRVDTIMKFYNNDAADNASEFFADMRDYFVGYLKSYLNTYDGKMSEFTVAAYLVIKKIYPDYIIQNAPALSFESVFRKIEDPKKMYTLLKDTKNTTLREDFLRSILDLSDWVDQYIRLFPVVLEKEIIQILIDKGHKDKVQQFVRAAFDDYRVYRDPIYFFFDECRNEEWFKEIDIPMQKQLIALVNIIALSYKAIDNHVNATENKKSISNICKILFEPQKDSGESIYAEFMLSGDKETMAHMYTIVDDISKLDEVYKAQLRSKILARYPDYKFHTDDERKKSSSPKGMLVTKEKLDEKRALEEQMRTKDLLAIAKEVAEAKEKGDLKENAEYIAAKEAQHKLGLDLKRLQEELARAVIFDPTTATASLISFGTKVVLLNNKDGKEETVTILGPWESDPENGIISYMSPFGTHLLDHKNGDELKFRINDNEYDYTVKSITLLK
ncbi:MAG: transcription elongation factor GreA [Treponema sp.]|nr:transcription elongation factor GreA [Treponema sp.]